MPSAPVQVKKPPPAPVANPKLTTLVSFNGANGSGPEGSLIADAKGDLFGTTQAGGANGDGTVFEIAKTAHGYASTPTTLLSFNGTNGSTPQGNLFADAKGDLLGTATFGGANDDGTVFEIAKTAQGYASTPATLVTFNEANGAEPLASLIADTKGDLFGTTQAGGAYDDGTVFEIAKTASGYASTPTTLVSFNETNGRLAQSSLIADAKGDLFGTTSQGGANIGGQFLGNGDGTVFEIAKTATGYASTPTTLVSFNGTDGAAPLGSLTTDAKGDLFGTTSQGGSSGDGTVFEIAKTAAGHASTPTTLVSFNGAGGGEPAGGLIVDAKGDLFGTTASGGTGGSVFEIAKTATGYASTATTLISFNGTNGANPSGNLIADGNGDLIGTTFAGGANGNGTVFEITASGFAVSGHCAFVAAPSAQSDAPASVTLGDLVTSEAANIGMADLLPGTPPSSGQSTAQGGASALSDNLIGAAFADPGSAATAHLLAGSSYDLYKASDS